MRNIFWAPGGPAVARTTVIAAVLLAAFAGTVGCGGEEYLSLWCDRPVVIDGSSEDWDGAMIPVEETHIAVGFLNDDQYLYLCLIASDPADQMQILTGGLTLWVDPKGGKDRTLGIRYPVGGRPSRAEVRKRQEQGEHGPYGEPGGMGEPGERREPPDLDSLLARMTAPNRLEIRNGKDELLESFALDATPGLEARIGNENGALVYELRLPLAATEDRPFAVNPQKGRVGLGLETAEMARPQMDRPDGMGGGPGGGPPGGGRGGMGGLPGGGRGGPPGMMREQVKPIDLWARVILATPASGTWPSGD